MRIREKNAEREREQVMFDIVLHYQLLIVTWVLEAEKEEKFVSSHCFVVVVFYLDLM